MIVEQFSGLAARANLSLTYGPKMLLAGTTSVDVGEILGEMGEGSGDSFTTLTDRVNDVGGGAYHIMTRVGIYIALFAIVLVAIGLMFANTNERQEKKSKLIWVIVGCVVMLGAGAILIFAGDLSNSIAPAP